jgi:hypothetical protein
MKTIMSETLYLLLTIWNTLPNELKVLNSQIKVIKKKGYIFQKFNECTEINGPVSKVE